MEFDLGAVETDAADIVLDGTQDRDVRKRDRIDQSVGDLVVIVEDEPHPVVEQAEIHTGIQLGRGFPLQAGIGHDGRQQRTVTGITADGIRTQRVFAGDRVVAGLAVGDAELEVVHGLVQRREERFLTHDPSGGDGGEEAPLVALGEEGGSVVAERAGHDVAVGKIVLQTAEVGDEGGLIELVAHLHGPGFVVAAGDQVRNLVRQGARVAGIQVPVGPLGPLVTGRSGDAVQAEGLVQVEISVEALARGLGPGLGRGARGAHEVIGIVAHAVGIVMPPVTVVVDGVLGVRRQPVGNVPAKAETALEAVGDALALVEDRIELGGLLFGVRTARGEGPVRVLADVGRRHHQAAADGGEEVVRRRDLRRMREIEGRVGLQVLGHAEGGVAVEGQVLVGVGRQHARIVDVTDGGGILDVLVAAVDADILLMVQDGPEPFLLPVAVGIDDGLGGIHRVGHGKIPGGNLFAVLQITGGVGRRGGRVPDTGAVGAAEHIIRVRAHRCSGTHDGKEFRGVGQVPGAGRADEAHLGIKNDLGLLEGVALLRRDEDDTIGGTGAVDGGRSRILEDLDALDVVRVQVGDITLHAVDQAERILALVDGRTAADEETRRGTGQVVVGRDAQAGDLALEGVADRRDRRVHQLFTVHFGDGGGQGLAGLGAVTDDHDVVQQVFIHLQGHIDDSGTADALLLVLIADEGVDQRLARFHLDGIAAVQVGDRTGLLALDEDAGAGERFTGGVGDPAADDVGPLFRAGRSRVLGQNHRLVDDVPADALAGESLGQVPGKRGGAAQGDIPERNSGQSRFVGEQHAGLLGEGLRERTDGRPLLGDVDVVAALLHRRFGGDTHARKEQQRRQNRTTG